MVERGKRGYAGPEQPVGEAVVEIKPRTVDRTLPPRHHPGPRDGESVGPDAEILHERNIFIIAVVMVACSVAALSPVHRSRFPAEHVPD